VLSKYLSAFPKPVLEDLIAGKWLPVVGAGMSLNAIVPPGKKMPLWPDLADALAQELTSFSSTSALDSISAFEHEFGRARLIEQMRELLLIREAQPGNVHREFCTLPFDIVCTTNFDFLLERQYELTPRYVYPVIDEEQLSVVVGSAGTLLLKLHGDLNHPNRLIATELDYERFLHNYPLLSTYLSNLLITKTAVLVGYSLDDPDFRQIWRVVSDRLGRHRRFAYTIQVGASSSNVDRFERRGVKVINLPGSRARYGEVLAQTFHELREYLRDNVISISKVTEEQPLRELLLPRGSTTRLCFFSLPLDLLPFYRERVFPVAEEAGFVPVTAEDVITPGDSVSAKLDTLVDRASVMITELTSSWTAAEYRMAIARLRGTEMLENARRPLQLIVVTTNREQIPPSAKDFEIVVRPNVITEDTEVFLAQLGDILRRIASQIGFRTIDEPQRLFNAGEYRAAVISAMTLLEETLREELGKNPSQSSRALSLRTLVDGAIDRDLLSEIEVRQIRSWVQIRNQVVHSSMAISKAKAREIVNGVRDVRAAHNVF
jgi:hypothetical protein